jgi:peptidoglycan/xylan/chitin deacetylase (PgdA/CDA1 family)
VFLRDILKVPLGFLFYNLPSAKRLIKDGITVFVYHEVTDTPSQFSIDYGLSVSNNTFRKQIRWIQKHFNIIHPKQLTETALLPNNAALITFDDGMLTSFDNGLSILKEMNIPSLFFLNMGPIVEKKPLVSAIACYLGQQSSAFKSFCGLQKVDQPYHLTFSPTIANLFLLQHNEIDNNAVMEYQGQFAAFQLVEKWSYSPNVVYGNHLYEHWNAEALNDDEFRDQYIRNEKLLMKFSNFCKFFAFPNGQPKTCFNERHIRLLKEMGAVRIFSSSGRINSDKRIFLLDRISFGMHDQSNGAMWFKIGFTYLKSKFRKFTL